MEPDMGNANGKVALMNIFGSITNQRKMKIVGTIFKCLIRAAPETLASRDTKRRTFSAYYDTSNEITDYDV